MQKNSWQQRVLLLTVLLVSLAGCANLDRLKWAASPPELSQPSNPTERPGYERISMPMPETVVARRQANSLWRPGSRTFFEDLRASRVGDIVTVLIDIADRADFSNASNQERTSSESAAAPQILGLQRFLTDLFPNADPNSLISYRSARENVGAGTISRRETINIEVAAVVTQLLPNGNMVIHGRQETRVNSEVRELQVAGVIRPQDVDTLNQISYDKIAEARVSYGGRGDISDVQRPRYGANLIDIILPF